MTDTRAAAVAALAATFIETGVYMDADDPMAGMDQPQTYAAAQLTAILASPEHRAALLAVLDAPPREHTFHSMDATEPCWRCGFPAWSHDPATAVLWCRRLTEQRVP